MYKTIIIRSNVSMLVCSDVFQVDKYLKEILQDVLSNLTSNTWRVRESRYNNNTRTLNIKLLKMKISKTTIIYFYQFNFAW